MCERHGAMAFSNPTFWTWVLGPSCHRLPLSGSNLSPSNPNPYHLYPSLSTASNPWGNKRINQPDLSNTKLRGECGPLSRMTGISFSLFSFSLQSDVEKSVLTLKVGYRTITGFVLKTVQGKRQINTFHILLWWSAIDQGLHIATRLHNQHGALFQNVLF